MGGRERSEACFWSCCERPKAEGKAARVARPPHPALCATFSRRREKGCQVRAATHSGPGHNVQTHDAAALPTPDPDSHARHRPRPARQRSEEHTSELQSLMIHTYAVFCLKKQKTNNRH